MVAKCPGKKCIYYACQFLMAPVLDRINQLVLQKDAAATGGETVRVVKGHFHSELSYGLKLHGFLQDFPEAGMLLN